MRKMMLENSYSITLPPLLKSLYDTRIVVSGNREHRYDFLFKINKTKRIACALQCGSKKNVIIMKKLEILNEAVTDDLLSEMEMLQVCGGSDSSNPDTNVYCNGAFCVNCTDNCGGSTCGGSTCGGSTCGSNNSGNGSGNVGNGVYILANCKKH